MKTIAAAAAIYALQARVPTGFLPEEDQEAFFVSVQLPDGASVTRTSEAVRRIEESLRSMPLIETVSSITGTSIIDNVNEPNAAFVVPTLKPFADRVGAANSAQPVIGKVFAEGQQIRTAMVIPFNLPPIIGLLTTGGFEYELEGLEGQDPAAMNSSCMGYLPPPTRMCHRALRDPDALCHVPDHPRAQRRTHPSPPPTSPHRQRRNRLTGAGRRSKCRDRDLNS